MKLKENRERLFHIKYICLCIQYNITWLPNVHITRCSCSVENKYFFCYNMKINYNV